MTPARIRRFEMGQVTWELGRRTYVMGILNVTPDSFSDGGRFFAPKAALAHAQELVAAGADIIDVGAESTRPGYVPVPLEEEWARLEPVLGALRTTVPVPISVDTQKAEIARRAISLGVSVINDIGGLADAEMVEVLKHSQAGYVLMYHPSEDIQGPITSREIRSWLSHRIDEMLRAGIARERILVDPGLGFAYGVEANWSVIADLEAVSGLAAGV